MYTIDIVVLVIYLIGLIGMGSIFSRLKNTSEMFAAAGKSPWWLSGLSSFMTTFSAGTFVVWGGIAYRFGMVSVSILMVIGIAALFAGWFLASRWKKFGYTSAAEFLNDRFGRSLVHFYTLLQGLVGLFTMGGAVYALAVVITALVPLSEGHLLANPETGYLSVTFTSLALCALVILITFGGGLWAVLMTDALQFIILSASVLIVVPLILAKIGGPSELFRSAPDGFTELVNSEFSWYFLIGWSVVFFFKIGGEWAYVQRFVCVPNSKDAQKATYLFGILYIVSPFIWMIPPMAYRILNPDADYEQAYILASQEVLPAGMLGLMIAAMCSATASMATTQLNVFAGAFTTEFYQRIFRPAATDGELVKAGRVFTLFLGGIIIAGALLIPALGTYTGYILASVAILTGPLVLPTIWGLYSRKIGIRTAWAVTIISIVFGLTIKIGFQQDGFLTGFSALSGMASAIQVHERLTEVIVGTLLPLLLLAVCEAFSKEIYPGWNKVQHNRETYTEGFSSNASALPARLCAWSSIIVAILMALIALLGDEKGMLVLSFSIGLALLGATILWYQKKKNKYNIIISDERTK
ncbi:hypothetical protein LS482_07150 [Sinomicrobium kalidii]|uniref:sodium:solute symporter family transporter n=1 Tax=Sinomicrobium kalidii TaxID=2900738 RepID=UPI001E43C493|nr:hypothetical protein [Sinomicrobium kalidii]UGU17645.1 hypothetical protein LS482_07150 [Sinomicrobium kalidii]